MCGIAGSVNLPVSTETVFPSLYHRGPDEQGHFFHEQVRLFSLRLSIQDKTGGKQPMHFGERYALVFNGEIYNHYQLRHEYRLSCRTNSDTETLLILFDKLGENCLPLLDGMFAFALYDRLEEKIFFARDRAGEKPLYYFNDSRRFVFASELNCLSQLIPLEINEERIYEYLRLGYFFKKNTPYKNVRELEVGSCGWLDVRTLSFSPKKWWDIGKFYNQRSDDDFETAAVYVEESLKTAVHDHLKTSDLEVGTFLSGGIDSGLVTAMAAAEKPGLKTFTVSFEGSFDEAPLARKVANQLGAEHHEIRLSYEKLPQEIEGILARYGEPFFDSSAIPSYYVSRAAKEFVTVILTGDGADELFGGYRRYVPFAHHDFFKRNKLRQTSAGLLQWLLPPANHKHSAFNYLDRLVFQSARQGIGVWLTATQDVFEGFENHLIKSKGNLKLLPDLVSNLEKIINQPTDALQKFLWFDFETLLPGDFLVKMDIASMAHSLEVRNPFLSRELLEYAPTLPAHFKVQGKTTKKLLRFLARKHLPGEPYRQPKRGFEVPLKKWVNQDLRSIIDDYLNSKQAFFLQFLDVKFVQDLMKKRVRVSEEKRAKMLWSLFALEVWHKNFEASKPDVKNLRYAA